jgi:hypothetical protein
LLLAGPKLVSTPAVWIILLTSLLIISPRVDLETNFESYLTVPITQSDVQFDMEMHVRQQLEKLQIGANEDTSKDFIVTELIHRAEGM